MRSTKSAIYIVTTATLGMACNGLADTISGGGPDVRNPPPPPPKQEVRIAQLPDGTCTRQEIEDCPPDKKCNPPAPTPVDCPPLNETGVTNREGTCVAVQAFECPPEFICPKPNEKKVDCPNDLKPGETLAQKSLMGCYIVIDHDYRDTLCPPHLDRPLPSKADVFKRQDGTCYAAMPINCPPDATCNPPPPTRVTCPDNMKK